MTNESASKSKGKDSASHRRSGAWAVNKERKNSTLVSVTTVEGTFASLRFVEPGKRG